jgi:rhodanese-related sulfurtransferase
MSQTSQPQSEPPVQSTPSPKLAAIFTSLGAHAAALAGDVILVDIRTDDEWRATGVATSAHAITMNQAAETFFKQLDAATGGSKSKPIALICASGNRSATLLPHLTKAGYTAVSDVSEGMTGGPSGAGWIKSGLPVRSWTREQSAPNEQR